MRVTRFNRRPYEQTQNPVFALTAPVELEFALLCRVRTEHAKQALAKATKWLRAGLTGLGSGAKTAAGYGYFAEASS
jgi:CRISPR-associated protein Cmr6